MRHLFCLLLIGCPGPTSEVPVTPLPTSTEPVTIVLPSNPDDLDGDGSIAGVDCDDQDPNVFPGAPEACNGTDDDCSGEPDAAEVDADGDGALDCTLCDAEGFFVPTRGLSGSPLVAALNQLTAAHNCTDYQDERRHMFVSIDKRNGEVECVYTGRTTPVGNTEPDATDINTEHTWPRSQGAGSEPEECDIHHLFPTDAMSNSRRGSLPFGNVVTTDWAEGGSSLGDDGTGTQVFEPRDVHKGNAARAILYFSMRYGFPVDADYRTLLVGWSGDDPVDSAEIERTLAIRDRQGVSNPYVVCPDLPERL